MSKNYGGGASVLYWRQPPGGNQDPLACRKMSPDLSSRIVNNHPASQSEWRERGGRTEPGNDPVHRLNGVIILTEITVQFGPF